MTFHLDEEWTERFWSKVSRPEDSDPEPCWEWQASFRKDGYGQVWWRKNLLSAHRVAYELHHGLLPEGYVLRHTCDNPTCCNPHHLIAGTQEANMRDMVVRGRNRFRSSRSRQGKEISL